MIESWFYQRGDERVGPLTGEQIRDLARTGKITRQTLLWKQSSSGWINAGRVAEFDQETASRSPRPLLALLVLGICVLIVVTISFGPRRSPDFGNAPLPNVVADAHKQANHANVDADAAAGPKQADDQRPDPGVADDGQAIGNADDVAKVAKDAEEPAELPKDQAPEIRRGFLRFKDAECVEITRTAGVLNLNGDFTIELWARWPNDGKSQYFATDEVWPEMNSALPVQKAGGWALRYNPPGGSPGLEFAIANAATGEWLTISCGSLTDTESWKEIAISKSSKIVRLFVNGKLRAFKAISGMRFAASPTNIFVGVRRFAYGNRRFGGDVRAFRISTTARYDADYAPAESFAPDAASLAIFEFSEGDSDFVQDLSGNGHRGLILGPTWLRLDEPDAKR